MRLAKPVCPEKDQRAEELVTLVNAGGMDISIPWQSPLEGGDQAFLRVRAGYEKPVPAKVAWGILGDPDLRPGENFKPMPGSVKEWNLQMNRLQNFHGYKVFSKYKGETALQAAKRVRSEQPDDPGDFEQLPMPNDQERYNEFVDPLSMWKYILDGHLYIKEWAAKWGKGKDFYKHAKAISRDATIVDVGGREVPIGAGGRRTDDIGGEEVPTGGRRKAVA